MKGTKTITYLGINSAQHPYWLLSMKDTVTSQTIKIGNITIDYGNGTKDKTATVIVNGETGSYTFQ